MISGFARAAQVLQQPEYAQFAWDAAQFIHEHLYIPQSGFLLRSAYKADDGGVAQM